LFRLAGPDFDRPQPVETTGRRPINDLAATADAIWLATTKGLVRLSHGAVSRLGESDGLEGNNIRSLAVGPGGLLWYAAWSRGVGVRWPVRETSVPAAKGAREWKPVARAEAWDDSRGIGWIGALASDGAKGVWLGSAAGELFHARLDRVMVVPAFPAGPPGSILDLACEPGRCLWIATSEAGLLRLPLEHMRLD
jgi:ligand-binding sensor domain-containing protein